MLPEQVWWSDPSADGTFTLGTPTGSAMPLCWAHAEYIALVRSRADGVPFDRVEPAYERYVVRKNACTCEMWTRAHQLRRIAPGRTLRIISSGPALIHWRTDEGDSRTVSARATALGPHFTDLETTGLAAESQIEFALLSGGEADGSIHRVTIGS